MRNSRRLLIGSLVAAALAVAGSTVVGVSPASAGGQDTTLSCSPDTTASGKSVLRCTATDPDGIQTIVSGGTPIVVLDCTPGANTTVNFTVPNDGPKRVVNVNDCEKPRERARFVAHSDGTVTGPTFR